MISIGGGARRLCDGVSRRELLRLGGLPILGFGLSHWLDAEASANSNSGRANACIFFFQEGGLAHQDSWDPKPDGPSEVRGEFSTIPTTVPGIRFSEHLPRLAKQAHRFALVRSVTHEIFDHNPGAYYCLTGRSPVTGGGLVLGDRPTNFPGFGGVLSQLRPSAAALPSWVQIPALLSNNGEFLPGQKAGFLGGAHDPLILGDPTQPEFQVPGLTGPPSQPLARTTRRAGLLAATQSHLEHLAALPGPRDHDAYYRRAFELLTSSRAREACNLEKESAATRSAYGAHHLGQSFLLARRLVEAGVRLTTVTWGPNSGSDSNQCWDTHRRNFHFLKNSLLPPMDRALAALISDLHDRGLLETTLVVAMGEFGRTPKINAQGGRDHWPSVYSVFLAGGGIRGGLVYGSSDASAAYPSSDPVRPEDVAATLFSAMGVSPHLELHDREARPHPVALGTPIRELFG